MLAAIAYPAQETLNPRITGELDLPDALAPNELSPSLINGGLSPNVLIAFLGLASGLELYQRNLDANVSGDYGWRLSRYTDDELFDLQAGELWNGRIAMIATLGYIVQEAVTKMPVLT